MEAFDAIAFWLTIAAFVMVSPFAVFLYVVTLRDLREDVITQWQLRKNHRDYRRRETARKKLSPDHA